MTTSRLSLIETGMKLEDISGGTYRHLSPAAELAPILFVVANLVIGGLAIGSIVLLMRGQLLQPIASKDTARQSFEGQKHDASSFSFREKSNG